MKNLRITTMSIKAAAMFLCVAAITFSAQAEAVQLRLRFQPGDTYRLVSETVQDAQAMGMNQRQESGQGYRYEVLEVFTTGDIRMRVTYDWMMMKLSGGPMSVNYDSSSERNTRNAGNNPIVSALAAMVGESFEMTVTDQGQLVEVKGMGEVMQKVAATMGNDPTAQAMREQLSLQYNDKTMTSTMQGLMTQFPADAVEVGSGWANTQTITDGQMTMQLANNYTLDSVENGQATILLETTISTPANAPPLDMAGMKMSTRINGTMKGWIVIDQASGMMLATKADTEFSGNATIEAEGLPRPMNTPIKSSGTTTIVNPVE